MTTADVYHVPTGYRQIPSRLNLASEVLQHAGDHADRVGIVCETGTLTIAELERKVDRFAHSLAACGIGQDTRVLIRMPNCPEFAIAFLALVKRGALPVLANSLLGPVELDYIVDHAEPYAAITLASVAEPLRERRKLFPGRLIVARSAEESELAFEALVAGSVQDPFLAVDKSKDSPAFIVYTSGTTGPPKAILHAHRWIIALGDSNRLRLPPLAKDVVMSTAEWSFIAGLGQNLLFPLRNGVTCAILEGRAFPERVLEHVERYKVTILYSVATVYRRILAMKGVEGKYNVSSLRGCNSTGEALEERTYTEWKNRFGCDIWEHYGVSEMQMVFGQGPCLPVRTGSVGVPLPGIEVRILDDQYRPVPNGEIGNLMIAADDPGMFLGYDKDAEKTSQVVRDGWYHTGDLGRQDDDGYIYIAGRGDDCFKSKGIFISPLEVENALRQHPAVTEACVVPRKDAEIGNSIRALIVLQEGGQGTAELADDIRRTLRSRIAPYKVPQIIDFVAELPKSAVGKVLRRELRD